MENINFFEMLGVFVIIFICGLMFIGIIQTIIQVWENRERIGELDREQTMCREKLKEVLSKLDKKQK